MNIFTIADNNSSQTQNTNIEENSASVIAGALFGFKKKGLHHPLKLAEGSITLSLRRPFVL